MIGSAWTEWVRPIITVLACSRALRRERGDRGVQLGKQQPTRGAALQRERRVDHVAAGQPEMDPATRLADRLGHLADERDHVVIRRSLKLGDALRRRRGLVR